MGVTLVTPPQSSPRTNTNTNTAPPPHHQQNVNALVVGTTHRYKGKYITSVLYKPRPGRRREDAHQHFPSH